MTAMSHTRAGPVIVTSHATRNDCQRPRNSPRMPIDTGSHRMAIASHISHLMTAVSHAIVT